MHNEEEMVEVLCLSYSASTDLKQFWIGAERSGVSSVTSRCDQTDWPVSKLITDPYTFVCFQEEFKHVDGSAFDYHQWHNGQPDNFGGDEDCVESNYEGKEKKIRKKGCTTTGLMQEHEEGTWSLV